MQRTIIDDITLLKNITWYDLDKKGYVNKSLKYEPAVYIYKIISLHDNKVGYYVGSSLYLAKRISSHRSLIIAWDEYKRTGSPIFYRSIKKYGWLNFKFAVLEHVNLRNVTSTEQKRKILLYREQYYLDSINPSLNTCKIADSPLGIKRDAAFSINLSKSRRGKSIRSIKRVNIVPKVVTSETKLLISSRCQGVSVKIFDKSNNLVNEFPTITSAASHFGVNHKTISMIFKTGKSYDDYTYKFEVRDTKVWVYNINIKLIIILNNIRKTSEWSNIAESTISTYIKSGKLYKNKFYFRVKQDVNFTTNSYFYNKN